MSNAPMLTDKGQPPTSEELETGYYGENGEWINPSGKTRRSKFDPEMTALDDHAQAGDSSLAR